MTSKTRFQALALGMLVALLAGCATDERAPVIDRAPQHPSTSSSSTAKPLPAGKDWRPELYTVKKGDTLYSIGLQYGYDYKEIAQANNLSAPYTIQVGQQLRIKGVDNVTASAAPAVVNSEDDGVVVTPMKMDPGSPAQASTPAPAGNAQPAAAVASPAVAANIAILSEPRALREAYSEQALASPPPPAPTPPASSTAKPAAAVPTTPPTGDAAKPAAATVPAAVKPADVTKPEPAKVDSNSGDDESLAWAWPTNGKLVSSFNEASNSKGIDITGTPGQAINAAAAGKVIYSGADLRGYGKMVIIKHNKTYLSVYAHNSQIVVKEGQSVSKGQKIAEMGNTDAERYQLHFEIRQQGKSVDPSKYLPAN